MKKFIVFVSILLIVSSTTTSSASNHGFNDFISSTFTPPLSPFNQGYQNLRNLTSGGYNRMNFGGLESISGLGGALNLPGTIQKQGNLQK